MRNVTLICSGCGAREPDAGATCMECGYIDACSSCGECGQCDGVTDWVVAPEEITAPRDLRDLRDLRRDHLALHQRATELARDLGRARDEAASARDEAAAARHWEGEARRQQASETANHGKTWSRLQRAREVLPALEELLAGEDSPTLDALRQSSGARHDDSTHLQEQRMTPTAQRKLRDALMGAKVNVTNDELDSWDAWRDHCDVDPAPSLVSTPYSARTFEAWNKATSPLAYCSRCADTVRGATPSDAFLCPFCWSMDREQIAGWAASSPSLYLSVSSGRWRVIHRGSSVCADGDEATARAVFRRYRVAGMAAPLWNGDEARWEIAPEVR